MTRRDGDEKGDKTPAEARAERLAAQLRANLQRRKAQGRARKDRSAEADETED
ncbi:hypothetical protein [Roseobacter sp. HKCCA0434]|uniref:hypothetical protein n=1 Tax=Roseobacter sp. HKCCA0434 TaxID=3079297 RepID=UPI002905E68F|nr:hypothetical protein [Roseobacter sp. HKCCA0434]